MNEAHRRHKWPVGCSFVQKDLLQNCCKWKHKCDWCCTAAWLLKDSQRVFLARLQMRIFWIHSEICLFEKKKKCQCKSTHTFNLIINPEIIIFFKTKKCKPRMALGGAHISDLARQSPSFAECSPVFSSHRPGSASKFIVFIWIYFVKLIKIC